MVVLQSHRRTKVEPNLKTHDGLFLKERSNTVQCNWHSPILSTTIVLFFIPLTVEGPVHFEVSFPMVGLLSRTF